MFDIMQITRNKCPIFVTIWECPTGKYYILESHQVRRQNPNWVRAWVPIKNQNDQLPNRNTAKEVLYLRQTEEKCQVCSGDQRVAVKLSPGNDCCPRRDAHWIEADLTDVWSRGHEEKRWALVCNPDNQIVLCFLTREWVRLTGIGEEVTTRDWQSRRRRIRDLTIETGRRRKHSLIQSGKCY